MIQYSAAGKARSEALRRECVEFLAHYSLSKTHKNCTVTYDKDTATIKVCEDNSVGAAAIVEENGHTPVFARLNTRFRLFISRVHLTLVTAVHELVACLGLGGGHKPRRDTIRNCFRQVVARREVSFSGTGVNEWYRALNRAGYRTFMAGHELVLTVTKGGPEEEVWYYLTPPLQHGSSSQESSSEPQSTSTGAITFMGHNTSCTFQIVVSYNGASE